MTTMLKTCCMCREDLSHVKRTKDTEGKYYCGPCLAKRMESAQPRPRAARDAANNGGTTLPSLSAPSVGTPSQAAEPLNAAQPQKNLTLPRDGDGLGKSRTMLIVAISAAVFLIAAVLIWAVLFRGGSAQAIVKKEAGKYMPLVQAVRAYRDAKTSNTGAPVAMQKMVAAYGALPPIVALNSVPDDRAKQLLIELEGSASLIDMQCKLVDAAFNYADAAERAGSRTKYEDAVTAFSSTLRELDACCDRFLRAQAAAETFTR